MMLRPGPDHDRWEGASGAYLLGAMEPEEAAAYGAHLARCPVCHAEVQDLRSAVHALPLSVPQLAAPAALEDRVMALVRSEAERLPAGPSAAERRRARPRPARWRLRTRALAVGALAVGIVLGVVSAGLIGGSGARTIPMAATGVAQGARVQLVLHDGAATLRAARLRSPGPGRVYQVWLQPTSGPPQPTTSLFVPRHDGNATVGVADVGQARAVLVTAEPDGGSPAPTSAPVLAAVTD
jgi:anti-sigma factor RsiW